MNPALVDTGFLIAVYDRSEPLHARCFEIHRKLQAQFVTCEAVVTEAIYLLRRAPGAASDILDSIDHGALQIPFTLAESAEAVAAIMQKYADTPADFADACLIHLAGQLGTGDILTLDSDFRHYRWRRNRRFRLLIPLD